MEEHDVQTYYAAAILLWCQTRETQVEHFDTELLKDWTYIGEHKTAFGDMTVSGHRYIDNQVLLDAAIMQLIELEAIVPNTDPYGPVMYEILEPHILSELAHTYSNSPFYKANRYGISWIEKALKSINSGVVNENVDPNFEISVEDWHPLPIDRGDEKYTQAIEATEEAIKAIEQDNGYAANEPDERNAILATSKGTLEAIKEGKPTKEQVESGLLKSLKQVVKRFGDASVGIIAKKTIEAIWAWFASMLV